VDIWSVGTDIAKGTIYNRLKLVTPGPGYCHFPIGLEDEYYLQLTAEKLVKRYVKGFQQYEWVNTRQANHALDCEVYCLAAAYRAGMQTINWASISARLSVPIAPGTQIPAAAPQRPARKTTRPAKAPGGYVRPSWMG
jgi:phage terminase large subunit GpA-like protein